AAHIHDWHRIRSRQAPAVENRAGAPIVAMVRWTRTGARIVTPAAAIPVPRTSSGGTAMLRIPRIGVALVAYASWAASMLAPVPVQADMLDTGSAHTCAIGAGGTIKCWGRNFYGGLGNGTMVDSMVPTDVAGITGATAVAAGVYHSCAIVAGGQVKCWGRNDSGQLGDGTTNDRLTPVRVVGIGEATAIAAGGSHTCAIIRGGAVHCWGGTYSLGNGTPDSSPVPVAVSGIHDASAIAAGVGFTCAIVGTGTVKCWGYYVFDEDETY